MAFESSGLKRPAVIWSQNETADVSSMLSSGFRLDFVLDGQYGGVKGDVGEVWPRLGEGVGSFSRGSTGTYVTDDGQIQTAAIDEPRLQDGGLLMEPQRTNELLQSEDFTAADWAKSNITITSGATTAPDGSATADKLTESNDSSNTAHLLQQSVPGLSDGVTYVDSIYAKAIDRKWVRVMVEFEKTSDGSTELTGVYFDTENGVVGTEGSTATGNSTTGSVSESYNSFYRLELTATPASGWHVSRAYVKLADADGSDFYTGSGKDCLYIWGAQLEKDPFPTSYIPTTTSTVTRSLDKIDPASDYAQTYDASLGLTLYAKFEFLFDDGANASDGGHVLRVMDSNDSNSLFINLPGSGSVEAVSKVSNTSEKDTLSTGASAGDTIEVALREKPAGFACQYSVNGGAVQDVTLSSISTNHADGLQWDKIESQSFGGVLKAASVARGDLTLEQMRTTAR